MRYFVNGKELTEEEFAARGPKDKDWLKYGCQTSLKTYRAHDPLLSDGIGCLKSQVPEMRETIRKHNIKGVLVRDDGKLEITSRRGRKELLRVRGLADADGMYSD